MANHFIDRTGEINVNKYNTLMLIIEYNSSNDIIVEFQDKYNYRLNTRFDTYKAGNIKNPYYPEVLGVGMVGNKYPTTYNGKTIKEYETWRHMLQRCFVQKEKDKGHVGFNSGPRKQISDGRRDRSAFNKIYYSYKSYI